MYKMLYDKNRILIFVENHAFLSFFKQFHQLIAQYLVSNYQNQPYNNLISQLNILYMQTYNPQFFKIKISIQIAINLQLKNIQTMQSRNTSEQLHLRILLFVNCVMFFGHIYIEKQQTPLTYVCQLTVIGQILVIANFYLSIFLHQDKCNLSTQLFLSRFHLITLALESIIVIGFWSLRVFFPKGILTGIERTIFDQIFSIWVHGGSFLTMFYFIKKDQIVTQTKKRKKVIFHLMWVIPFCLIQYLRWYFTGGHVYGFIKHFDWMQLVVFQTALFVIAVYFDYVISVRHGFKLLKNLEQHSSRSHIHIKID